MTLAQIQYFLTVAEVSNVSKAAEQLFMTQPALSRQIAAMEEELGIQLFIRKSRPIKLTPAGRELYQGWKHLNHEYENTLKRAQAKADGIEGILRIGVLSGLEIGDFLPEILHTMKEKYPHIGVDLESVSFAELQKGIQEEKYDLALTYDFNVDKSMNVEVATLEKLENFLVCSAALPIPEKEDYKLSDFLEYDFILNTPEDSPRGFAQFMEKVNAAGIRPRFKFADTANQHMLLVEAGYGISVLSKRSSLFQKKTLRFLHASELDHNAMILLWKKTNENPSLLLGRQLFQDRFHF